MKRNKPLLLLATSVFVLSSCVDDNYNLSDLDTTVGISVNKLTIPLNVDSLVLDEVIDLEENSQIKKTVVNGKEIYALVEEGTFKSKPIEIPGFTTKSPEIEPIVDVLKKNEIEREANTRSGERSGDEVAGSYPISNKDTEFKAESEVDKSIKDIYTVNVDANYKVDVNVADKDLMDKVHTIKFEGFIAKLPKGLKGKFLLIGTDTKDVTDKYDSKTGLIDMSGEEVNTDNGHVIFEIDIDAINLLEAGDEVTFKNGKFEMNTKALVVAGEIVVYNDDMKENVGYDELPNEIDYVCTPELSEIVVKDFSGEIQYEIDGINIDPVKMNDIPDILSQDGTDIKLANPQIYLNINNPLANQNIKAEANIEMTAKRNGNNENKSVSLDNGALNIDKNENVFCLTSDVNISREEINENYKNATIVPFTGLSDILSGNGLPKQIDIEVIDPQIPIQKIENFELDQDIAPVEGKYLFFAPLALKDESSVIVYKDTLNDWSDDTLEKLVISEAIVNANVKSEVPLELELKLSPIDVHGNKINNVESNTVKVMSSTNEQPIEISIKGEIKNLDGIIISAILRGSNGESISPDHKISFKNLKVTVTGNYIDEL